MRKPDGSVPRRRAGFPMALAILAIVGVAGGLLVARNASNRRPGAGLNPDSPWTLLASRPMSAVLDARADGANILIERHGIADKNAIAAAAATAFEQGKDDPLIDGEPQASPKAQAVLLQASVPSQNRPGSSASPSPGSGPGSGPSVKTAALGLSVVRLDVPGRESPIYVRKMKLGSETTLAAEPGTGTPYLHRSPTGTHYALVSEGHLILIDARTLAMTNRTPDVIGGSNRWSLWRKGNDAGKAIVWADNPVWTADGRRILYVSDRKSIQDGSAGSAAEIWSVDIETGEHQVVSTGQYFRQLIGCYGDTLAFSELDRVACLSLSTGEVRTLVADGRVIGQSSSDAGRPGDACAVIVTVDDFLTSAVASVTDVSLDAPRTRELRAPEGTAFVRAVVSPSANRIVAVVRDRQGRDSIAIFGESASGGGAGLAGNSQLTLLGVVTLPDRFQAATGEQFVSDGLVVINVSSTLGGEVREATYLLSTADAGQSASASVSIGRTSSLDSPVNTPTSAGPSAAYRPVAYTPGRYSGPFYEDAAFENTAPGAGGMSAAGGLGGVGPGYGGVGPSAGPSSGGRAATNDPALCEFSPLREGSPANEAFPPVTSKFNQPRHVSAVNTNPHQGSDVNSVSGDVYAAWNGWIAGRTSVSLTILIDADNDGVADDNLFVTYDHLRNVTTRANGSAVFYTDAIGQIDSSLLCPHLHFGNRTGPASDGALRWVKNEPYFRASQGWNAGRDLDLVSRTSVSGGKVTAQVYVKDEGRTVQISEGDVRIFYRLSGTGYGSGSEGANGAWTEAAMVKESATLFSFDLGARVGMKQVDFLIRVERGEQKAAYPGDCYWAFDPPKQLRPNPDPALQGEPAFYTVTLGGR